MLAMSIPKKLSEIFGLSAYEAKIYTALTSQGPLHVANISKYGDIPRTAVYPPLKSIIKKGLVAQTHFGKRKYYSAVPTENLKLLFEQKQNVLESVLAELNESRRISSHDAKLDTVLYLGYEGIKAAGLLFINETKEKIWHSFENLTKVTDSVGFEFESFYIKERIKRNIKSKMILSVTEESPMLRKILKEDKSQLRETIILSPNEYPFETTVAVTKGLILLVNPNQGQFALLIRNVHLANTFMAIHKSIWDRYKS
jgi:sugar-specific transcriptional regulator TrmB